MTRSRRQALIVAAVAAIAAFVAGCGGSSSSSPSASSSSANAGSSTSSSSNQSPVTIGASLSLSGDFAADGQAFQQGYQLWAADQNKAGRAARAPGQARHRLGRIEPGAGRHELQQADLLRPRPARVRPVLDAADRPGLEGRQPLRLRVRRGRRRRAGGVRQRPAQHLRRQRAGRRSTWSRSPSGWRRCRALGAAEDGRVRDQSTIRSRSRRSRSPRRSCRRPGSRPSTARCSPPRSPTTRRSPPQVAQQQGRGGGARLGRRADRVRVRPRIHPAALQPEVVHRDRGARPGRGVREGGRRSGNENGDLRPKRLVRRLAEGATARRWSRSTSPSTAGRRRMVNADVAEAYSVGQVGGAGRGRDARLRQREDHRLPAQRRDAEQRAGASEVQLARGEHGAAAASTFQWQNGNARSRCCRSAPRAPKPAIRSPTGDRERRRR